MAKKNNKPATTAEKKDEKVTKAPANKAQEKASTQKEKKEKKERVPEFIPEEVKDEVTFVPKEQVDKELIPLATGMPTRSSVDAKAKLVEYGYNRFINNQEFREKNPELHKVYAHNIDVVWLLAMVDIQNELHERKETDLVVKIPVEEIMPLQEIAASLGITLASHKALPSSKGEAQLEIDFGKTEIPKELRNVGKMPEDPDLDPKKQRTAKELAEVLNYLMRKERNIAVALVNTVEWYRKNRIEQASTADGKLAIDNKTVEELINEIFTIINVGDLGIFKGLGSTVYMYTKLHGSPIAAHSLLHHHMSKCGWSEEDIASACKALVQENFRLKKREDDKLNIFDDKAIQATIANLGNQYLDKVFEFANATTDGEDNADKKNEIEYNKSWANRLLQLVKINYFPSGYKPTTDELRMKIGQILNLYRDPMDRLEEYKDTTVEVEYPQKSKEKETKKEETEAPKKN